VRCILRCEGWGSRNVCGGCGFARVVLKLLCIFLARNVQRVYAVVMSVCVYISWH
jgi:hypothetical protein